jgi:protein-tyrosine-phosphatase
MSEAGERTPMKVLFVGETNSARSIMAEAILNREGKGKFQAFSAGIQPGSRVHPYAIDLLSKLSFDVSKLQSKSCLNFAGPDGPALDFVFTVCDRVADTLGATWPGIPVTGHWGVPDPAAAKGNDAEVRLAFADVFRMLNTRVVIFASLPIRSLDRRSLDRQLGLIASRKDVLKAPTAA